MNPVLKWKLIAGFLLVFIAGGVTGALFSAMMARHFYFAPRHGVVAQHMRERLQRELQLTPEQVQRITPAIEHSASELERIRLASARRVRQTFDETHREISENLTPEQRARWQGLHQRRERWMRSHNAPRIPAASPSTTPSSAASAVPE